MEMETLLPEVARLLRDTLSPDIALVSSATDGLDRLSSLTAFPRCLLSITTGGENQGQRIAAATYLKNLIKRGIEGSVWSTEVRRQLSNQLVQALLQVEPAVIKVLAEAFHLIVVKDFVCGDAWPELVSEIRSVIQNSNLINGNEYSQWKTINALAVIKMIVKPFQYFLNPKLSKEPVPLQLELIATEILVPLQATFHHAVNKALSCQGRIEVGNEQVLLTICKCLYFAVRSYMPSALSPLLPSFCHDLFGILDSLNLDGGTLEDGYLLRLKTGKRCLIIFSALVTRHRKHADKLMPNIITCASKIARLSANIVKLDFLSERIVSLAFDVISHVLETGPGWRLISPHFSSLLESTIFPALVLNQKDITEWEEDQEEYIRKNLPSDLEEISGWNEDFFTARKSALNLLGVIAMSKGPPMVSIGNNSAASVKRKKGNKNKGKQQRFSVGELLVMPFLSRFPIPSNAMETPSQILYDYYGVLMAYGGLQDFLRERHPEYTANLVSSRVLPLYSSYHCLPYLIATANWVIGELAPCLPQEMRADIYSLLVKVLAMPDGDLSSYPVRASAAGAIKELLENDYMPSDWLPLLHILVNRVNSRDENESSLLLQLLSIVVEAGQQNVAIHIPLIVSNIVSVISKDLPSTLEPWPQVVEHGFATLAVMAQTWEDSMPDEVRQNRSSNEWQPGWLTIARSFSSLLQQAWLLPLELTEGADFRTLPPPSCVADASKLLGFIARFITGIHETVGLKIVELLVVWADLIADWNAWQEMEDLSIFSSIREAVDLHRKFDFQSFFMIRVPSQPSPRPGTLSSIVEGMGAFVSKAISACSSAVPRACSSAHLLLHAPIFSTETESIKQSLAIAFTQAAFSRYKDIRTKHMALSKPILLLISSCYLCYPQNIERILGNDGEEGFTIWACGLAHICSSSFEPALSFESEMKLAVMALAKVIERLLLSPSDMPSVVLRNCFVSLMEVYIRLEELHEESDDEDDKYDDTNDVDDDEDSFEDTDDDEDSDKEEREETEEEFLDRYAKAAAALEDEMAVEGDVEDEVEDLELGVLGEIDVQQVVLSLMERHHKFLVGGHILSSPQLIIEFSSAFPEEYVSLFQH